MSKDARPAVRPVLLALCLLALALRGAHLDVLARGPLFTQHETFAESDMFMFDQWARRIVAGDLLGRETYQPLTAWQLSLAPEATWRHWYGAAPVFNKAPLYAYLVALMRALFGQPMLPLALLQVLVSAACVPLLYLVTRRLFEPEAGLLAALLFAVYAPSVHFSVVMLRDAWIVPAGLGVSLALLRLGEQPSRRRSLAAGLVAGAALVLNEAFVSLLLLALAWIAWTVERPARLRALALFVLGTALALSPVAARNLAVGAPVTSLAVMGSTALAVFDTAHSNPWFFEIHPQSVTHVLAQADGRLGATLVACYRTFEGGLPDVTSFYLRKSLGLLIPYENPDNVNFYYAALRDPLLRVLPGYGLLLPLALVGLGLAWRRWRTLAALVPVAASLLLGMLVMLPLSRYRATFAGVVLLPLAGHALAVMLARARQRRFAALAATAGAAACIALVAGLAQSRVVFAGRDAGAAFYRAPEFVLGVQFHERAGRLGAALQELRDLARLNPTPSVRVYAWLSAGQIHRRRAERPALEGALAAARGAAQGQAELLLHVADAYDALLGERATALALVNQALALSPPPALREILDGRQRILSRTASE